MPFSEFRFRGGGDVTKANHMTRYVYPALVKYPLSLMVFHTPYRASQRPRPFGREALDTTHITVTRAPKNAPISEQFEYWITKAKEQDEHSANPIGRAMRRVTGFPGNTTLEMGKFKIKPNKFVHMVRRTTSMTLGGDGIGGFRIDQDVYEIPSTQWRSLEVECASGFDSWHRRLTDLLYMANDRAYFDVQERMSMMNIAQPVIEWNSRKDIETAVNTRVPISRLEEIRAKQNPEVEKPVCIICQEEYWTEADGPVELPCGHFMCIACAETWFTTKRLQGEVEQAKDSQGRITQPGFTGFYIICGECRRHVHVKHDYEQSLTKDMIRYLSHFYLLKIINRMDSHEWPLFLGLGGEGAENYINFADGQDYDTATTRVRAADGIIVIDEICAYVFGLMPWGYTFDNPVTFVETQWLHAALKSKLWDLQSSRHLFTLEQLKAVLWQTSLDAFKPLVTENQNHRLGNPIFPPGYERYRKWLSDILARGCFVGPITRGSMIMEDICASKAVPGMWWKKSYNLSRAERDEERE